MKPYVFSGLMLFGITVVAAAPLIGGDRYHRLVQVGVSLASDEAPVQVTVTRTVRVAGSCDVPQACNVAQACDTAQYQAAECDVPSFLYRLFYGDCAGAAAADADDDDDQDYDDDSDD